MSNWTHNRFKYGSVVDTCLGGGVVIGIDLPMSQNAWRWLVEIKNPSNPVYSAGGVFAFFDKEVNSVTTK